MVFVTMARAAYNNKKTTEVSTSSNNSPANSHTSYGDGGGSSVIMETARELIKSWSADFGVVDATTSFTAATSSLLMMTTTTSRNQQQGTLETENDDNDDCSSGDDTPVTRFRKDAVDADAASEEDDDAEDKSSGQIQGGEGGSGSLLDSSSSEDNFGDSSDNDDDDEIDIGHSIDDDDDDDPDGETNVGDVTAANVDEDCKQETKRTRKNKACCFSRPILRPASSFREEIEIISRKRPRGVRGGGGGISSSVSSASTANRVRSTSSSQRRTSSCATSSLISKDDSHMSSTVSDDQPPPPTTVATGTSTTSSTSRLSEDRIQEILVAAMRYQTEHAATLPSPLPTHYNSHHHHHHAQSSLPTSPESITSYGAGGLVTITSPIIVPRSCLSIGTPPPTLTVSSTLPTQPQPPPPRTPPSQLLLPKLKTPPHNHNQNRHGNNGSGILEAADVDSTMRRSKQNVNLNAADVLHVFDDLHTNEALLMAEKALRHVEEIAESRASSSSKSHEVIDKHHQQHQSSPSASKAAENGGSNSRKSKNGGDHSRSIDTWGTEERRRLETIYSIGSEGESSAGPDNNIRKVHNDEQQPQSGQRQQQQQQLNRQWQQQYQQQQNMREYQSQQLTQQGQESSSQQIERLQQQGSVEWTTLPSSPDSTVHGDEVQLLSEEEDTLVLTSLMSDSDPVSEARRDGNRNHEHVNNISNNRHQPQSRHHPNSIINNTDSNMDDGTRRTYSPLSTERAKRTIPRATAPPSPPPQQGEGIEVDRLAQNFGRRLVVHCEDEKKEANHPDDVIVSSNNNNESLHSTKHKGRHPGKHEQKTWKDDIDEDLALVKSFSATESDVGSLDGLPFNLQSQLHDGDRGREDLMKRLDGVIVHTTPMVQSDTAATTPVANGHVHERSPSFFESLGLRTTPLAVEAAATTAAGAAETPVINTHVQDGTLQEPPALQHRHERSPSFFKSLGLSYFFGGGGHGQVEGQQNDGTGGYNMNDGGGADDTLALLGCAPICHNYEERNRLPAMPTSLIRVTSEPPPLSYAETIRATEVDPRLQDWLEGYYRIRGQPPSDGTYHLGKSRTVIVHEINRGNWTWCTAWSPTGDRLAVATENHHLAVIETTASTVWRVRHDRRIVGPAKNDVTHSIRSISWGQNFIAIGGTGNAVSILSPIEPYPILHVIKGTGFVGKLDWKVDSNILAIGSRLNKMMIVRIKSIDRGKIVESEVLHTVKFSNWVNRVAFSPGGSCLAVGDASGLVSVYNCVDEPYEPFEINLVDTFQLEDSVLDMEWAPDGRWLYVGGEDFHITVIETNYWEVVHRIKRDRWVQCIASSNGGNFLAVGGADSEISILDVKNGWDSVMGIGLKGLVPLWAEWHPKDQALALTGQNNSVLVVETTNARHIKGHHLHSISPILAVEFSPDGRMAVMGNEAGIVTFFALAGSTFETAYELVVTLNDRLSISWSMNGVFVAIGTKDTLLIVGSNAPKSRSRGVTYRHRPPSASGFSVRKVFRNIGETNVVAIDTQSHYVAAGGDRTRIYDSTADFKLVKEWQSGVTHAIAWSPDGKLLATFGEEKNLTIYDVANKKVGRWRAIFSLNCDFTGRALAWSPVNIGGLLYLAYGGRNNNILIMEIRTLEGTWETVLRIPRDGAINDMDWSSSGLLAVGIGNGTVTIIDLAYLQSGVPVNEKDYNWQRQALTCFTEIRRNRGKNSIRTVRWIPSAPGSDSLLAMGGTDGEVEIVDLTERERCRGYVRSLA